MGVGIGWRGGGGGVLAGDTYKGIYYRGVLAKKL